jgi:hypothetical protein
MKRDQSNFWLWVIPLALFFSCQEAAESEEPVQLGGLWDLTVFQGDPNVRNYLIEVIQGGGTGAAEIKAYSNRADNSGPDPVNTGVPITLGACGLEVTFSDSVSGPLSLVAGDRWNIVVANGVVYAPEPHPANRSLAVLTVSGTFICSHDFCADGLYNSFVPLPYNAKVGSGMEEFELDQVSVNQTDANLSGTISEQTVLSLFLVGHERGDWIQICYERKLRGAEGANSFRVRLADVHRFALLESKAGSNFAQEAETVCHYFQAQGRDARIDFIFSAANFNAIAWLDKVREKVNGTVVFRDDFESGALDNDLTPPLQRWQLRAPAYQQGDAMVNAIRPLQGNYSFRVLGGRSLPLTGSIMEQASNQLASLMGQVPGFSISGALLEIYENFRGGYFATLSGAMQERDAIIGTFTGETQTCRDQGQLIAAINQSGIIPVDTRWNMTLVGQAQNCRGVNNFRQVFAFTPTQKADRFYSDPNRPPIDDYFNSYQLNGRVLGVAMYFVLEDAAKTDYRTALFSGLINPNPAQGDSTTPAQPNLAGAFNGWLGFKNDFKCEVNGTFQVVFQ